MKLLMITGLGSIRDLASGKKGAFYNTLEEFHKYWDRIDIICPRIPGGSRSIFGNVYIHISPWPLIFHPIWFLKKGLEIYKEQKFDLMTVHEFPPFYNGIGARLLWSRLFKEKSRILDSRSESGQKTGVPYVMEIFHVPGYPRNVHSYALRGYPRGTTVKEEIYKSLMKIFIAYDSANARAVRIMNSEVGSFLEKAGVPKNKLILVPAIYVDLEIFKPSNLQKEYDLIFVGRLELNKGIDLFLEVVRKLNCAAIIVGDGSLKNEIKLKIENWKLKVNMHGWAKDSGEVAELLNKSKVLVMPSYNEGGPRVVVEALACGIPVLATSVGIVPDIMKDLPIGRQATSLGMIVGWDAEDIAKKAEEILKNYEVYRNAGLETVKQFEKKAAIKNYADKLHKLILS